MVSRYSIFSVARHELQETIDGKHFIHLIDMYLAPYGIIKC